MRQSGPPIPDVETNVIRISFSFSCNQINALHGYYMGYAYCQDLSYLLHEVYGKVCDCWMRWEKDWCTAGECIFSVSKSIAKHTNVASMVSENMLVKKRSIYQVRSENRIDVWKPYWDCRTWDTKTKLTIPTRADIQMDAVLKSTWLKISDVKDSSIFLRKIRKTERPEDQKFSPVNATK